VSLHADSKDTHIHTYTYGYGCEAGTGRPGAFVCRRCGDFAAVCCVGGGGAKGLNHHHPFDPFERLGWREPAREIHSYAHRYIYVRIYI